MTSFRQYCPSNDVSLFKTAVSTKLEAQLGNIFIKDTFTSIGVTKALGGDTSGLGVPLSYHLAKTLTEDVMAIQIVKPRIRGFISTNAHPTGCYTNVLEQIGEIKQGIPYRETGLNALVIGASTGYGLASRIALT